MGDAGRIRGYRNATRTTQAQYGHARHQDTPNLPKTEQVSYACITAISGTFNPLFKVLCTFPSRYLFAIGLESVLSFGWNVPPALRTHLRVHDSEDTARTRDLRKCQTGISPSMTPVTKGLTPAHPLEPCRNAKTHDPRVLLCSVSSPRFVRHY